MLFEPLPIGDSVSVKEGRLGDTFVRWLQNLVNLVMRAPSRQDPTPSRTDQAASIAATGLTPVTAQGLYRLTYYVRVTRAATATSSIALALSWVDGGVTQTAAPAALTGNTTTTYGTGTYLVYIDAGTTPTYATTYATTGATTMQYRVAVVVEMVST